MATKSKKNEKKSAPRQWQKNVAHVVEAALEAAAGRGATISAIAKKTGLDESKIERHLTYMAGKLDGYPLKNPRATVKNGVYRLTDVGTGSFRGESWIDDARAKFVGARKRRAKK